MKYDHLLGLIKKRPIIRNFAVTQVSCDTSTGTQDITISGFGTPVAAIFFVVPCATNGGTNAFLCRSYGLTDGTSDYGAFAYAAEGGNGTFGSASSSSYCVYFREDSGGSIKTAQFDSFITDGVRIDWTSAPTSGWKLACVLVGGNIGSSDVYAGTVASPSSGATTDVTSVGFQPDLTLTFCLSDFNVISFGVRDRANATNYGISHGSNTFTQTELGVFNNRVGSRAAFNVLFQDAVYLNSEDSSGFSITDDGVGLSGVSGNHYYLCIKLPTGSSVKSVGETVPTSTGNHDTTTAGFGPDFCIAAHSMNNSALSSFKSDSTANASSIEIYDGISECSIGVAYNANSYPYSCLSYVDDNFYLRNDTNSVNASANSSFLSNGIRRNYTSVTNGSTRYGWVFFHKT